MNSTALEFVRYTLQNNPSAHSFGAIYDAMTRAACARSFHNLGREELGLIGISFSLLATDQLEHLIKEAQKALGRDYAGEGGTMCVFETVVGDTFSIKPQINNEDEAALIEQLRVILVEEGE